MDGILPPKGRKPTNATTCQLPRMLKRASSNAFGRAAPSMRGAFATGVQFMCSTLPPSIFPSWAVVSYRKKRVTHSAAAFYSAIAVRVFAGC